MFIQIEKVYQNIDTNESIKDKLLHIECINCKKCWKNIDIKRGVEWNSISKAYIGEKYNNGLLGIGLNLHDSGGYDQLYNLIDCEDGVKSSLLLGKSKMNFGNKKYKGTLIFHRLSIYSAILLDYCILENNRIYTVNGIHVLKDKGLISNIYNEISFTEAIKCSPKGSRNNPSRPSKEMYELCPPKYLLKEIQMLLPRVIICFDKKIYEYLFKVFDCKSKYCSKLIEVCDVEYIGAVMTIYRIIHPQARYGNKNSIYRELYTIHNNIKEKLTIAST